VVRLVEVEVVQGRNEVGGTCIRLRDRDVTILFDQGLRFPAFKRLYGFRVRPRGPLELRSVGVLPPYEVVEGAEALYVTHFHMDHLGLLGDLPDELEIRVPSIASLELLEEWYRDSPDWTSYILPRYSARLREVEPLLRDRNNVVALPVPHSAYPSTSYLYFGSDETLLYTGDLRLWFLTDAVEKICPYSLFSYLEDNPDLKVDKLVIEGTNLGRPVTPITGNELRFTLRAMLSLKAPLLIAVHRLELDLLLAVLEELWSYGRAAVIASDKLLDVVVLWFTKAGFQLTGLLRSPSLADKPSRVELASPDDLRDPSSFAVIADLYELVDFARIAGGEIELKGGFALLLTSEHEAEEGVEESVAIGWLRRLGIQPYRLRVSGHYYAHELRRLLELIRPEGIIPVHTEAPDLLLDLARRFRT